MKKSTISDVAREADVSKSTVSRVINDAPNVDNELRDRVLNAIDKLDYQPNRAARTLKKNLQDVVGFIVPHIADTIFGSVLQGAQDFAYDNKMSIITYSTADNLKRQNKYLETLLAEQVAGMVIVPAPDTDPDILISIEENGIPIVLLDRKIAGFEADYIASNNLQGAATAISHLIENGYQRIATIAGSQKVSTGIERLTGYQMALSQANLPTLPHWVKYGNFDRQQSYVALKELVESTNPPDAVFVANDEMTIGVLQAIRDLQISIPDDLALVTFDEITLSSLLTPTLTTVEQQKEALGREAVQLLVDRIQSPDRLPRSVQIPTKLNIRDSSRPKKL